MAVPEIHLSNFENPPDLQVIDGAFDFNFENNENSNLSVIDYELRKTITKKGISRQIIHSVLNNKSTYDATIYTPEDPEVDYERLVVTSPAWFTNENYFFNRYLCSRLSKAGNTVVMFSHEQVLHRSCKDTKERFTSASVHNDANAQHAVLDVIDSEQIVPKSTDEIITTGMSKGSIVERLVVLYAAQYGREVPYFDGIDSSGEHRWTLKDFDLNKLKQIGCGPVLETIGLVKVAAETTPAQLLKMGLNYAADPRTIPGHLAYAPSLVRSEAGNDKGLASRADHIMHLTCQAGCWFNQHKSWEERFGAMPNAHVLMMPGGHIEGASKKVRDATIDRIIKVQDLLEAGHRPCQIDPATQTLRTPDLKIAA
jgi:hypothetical protein